MKDLYFLARKGFPLKVYDEILFNTFKVHYLRFLFKFFTYIFLLFIIMFYCFLIFENFFYICFIVFIG